MDGNPQPIRVALHRDDLRASASCEDRAAEPNGCLVRVLWGKGDSTIRMRVRVRARMKTIVRVRVRISCPPG